MLALLLSAMLMQQPAQHYVFVAGPSGDLRFAAPAASPLSTRRVDGGTAHRPSAAEVR